MKTKYRFIVASVMFGIFAIGCFIHSIENTPHLTQYYITTMVATTVGFIVGIIADAQE